MFPSTKFLSPVISSLSLVFHPIPSLLIFPLISSVLSSLVPRLSSHLLSSLISFYLITSHLISSPFSSHLFSSRLSSHFLSSRLSSHLISFPFLSFLISSHLISSHLILLPSHFLSSLVSHLLSSPLLYANSTHSLCKPLDCAVPSKSFLNLNFKFIILPLLLTMCVFSSRLYLHRVSSVRRELS